MSTAANPRAPKPSGEQQEPVGAVASDSLAAESIKADGAFAENKNAAISGVKGSNSTLNNTDTSGASVLQPAADGTERARQEAKGLGSDEKGTTGVKYPDAEPVQFDGTHSAEGYVGGPSGSGSGSATAGSSGTAGEFSGATGDSFADGATPSKTTSNDEKDPKISSGSAAAAQASKSTTSSSGGAQQTTSSSSGGAQESYTTATGDRYKAGPDAPNAPNYAATVSGAIEREGEGKPKGENLHEGGIPETKTFTGAVGGPNDPGRLAEQEFTKVGSGSVAAAGQKQHDVSADGPKFTGGAFDALESERA